MDENVKIAVIGLGYVGLPLARLFATKYSVVGFDINESRVSSLKSGTDTTLEVEDDVLQQVLVENPDEEKGLYCTISVKDIENCNFSILFYKDLYVLCKFKKRICVKIVV